MPKQPSWGLIAAIFTAAPVYEWVNLAGIGSSLVTPRTLGHSVSLSTPRNERRSAAGEQRDAFVLARESADLDGGWGGLASESTIPSLGVNDTGRAKWRCA